MDKAVKMETLIKQEDPPSTPPELRYLDEFANLPEVLPDRQPDEEYETRDTVPSPEIPNQNLSNEQALDDKNMVLDQNTQVQSSDVETELEKENLGPPEIASASGDVSGGGVPTEPPNSSIPSVELQEQQPAAQELAGMGKGKGKRVFGVEEFFAVASLPPPQLSEKAIDSRLRRVFKQRADGTMLVDESWKQQWADKEGRIKILEMFEKVGYNTDRVPKLVVLQDFGNSKTVFREHKVDPLATI